MNLLSLIGVFSRICCVFSHPYPSVQMWKNCYLNCNRFFLFLSASCSHLSLFVPQNDRLIIYSNGLQLLWDSFEKTLINCYWGYLAGLKLWLTDVILLHFNVIFLYMKTVLILSICILMILRIWKLTQLASLGSYIGNQWRSLSHWQKVVPDYTVMMQSNTKHQINHS